MLAGCRGSEAARPGGQSAKCLRWGVARYRTRRRSADKDDLFTARTGTPTGTSRVTGSATRSGAGTGGNLREHGTSRTNCVTHTARGFAGGADLPARQARRSGGLGAAAAVAVLETDDVLPPTGDGCGGLREAAARVATATSATCGHAELSSKINCVLPGIEPGPQQWRPACRAPPATMRARMMGGSPFPLRRRRVSRPVGRVLCARRSGPTAIHLGLPLPAASCGLPASIGRAALKHSRRHRAPEGASPFDLAPGGVYQAARITPGAGGLLHH